jgi:hypothetical protein
MMGKLLDSQATVAFLYGRKSVGLTNNFQNGQQTFLLERYEVVNRNVQPIDSLPLSVIYCKSLLAR